MRNSPLVQTTDILLLSHLFHLTDSDEPVGADSSGSVRQRQSSPGGQQGHRSKISGGSKSCAQVPFTKCLLVLELTSIQLCHCCRSPEFYPHRKEERCARQFGTTNPDHPCIKVKAYQWHKILMKSNLDDHGIWSLVGRGGFGGAWKDHLAGWPRPVQAHPGPGFVKISHT